jgi:sulfoxide reductase heme-binding subunit YedZ
MRAWISGVSSEAPRRGSSDARAVPARPGAVSPRTLAAIKVVLFAVSLAPLGRLVAAGTLDCFGGLGANPVERVTRSTGTWTLVFLCAGLAITPLRRLTGWAWLLRMRRMVGLFAFFYASLHLSTYLWFDQWFDATAIVKDVIKRPFIAMGMVAFVLLLPLAITSTDAMMRRLGRRWAVLHRAVYLAAIVGVLHFWWHKAGKNDYSEVGWYAAAVALLLGWRLIERVRARR